MRTYNDRNVYEDSFTAAKRVRVPKTRKTEIDGGQVTITAGLTNDEGDYITRIDVEPDTAERGGDLNGFNWEIIPGDGPGVVRLRRMPKAETGAQK